MDDSIIFKHRPLPSPLLDILNQENTVSGPTLRLLQAVFDHGGYIAGGFGTLLARHFVLGECSGDEPLRNLVREHLRSPRVLSPEDATRPLAWRANAGCGDIDVWFPDEASLQSFKDDESRLQMLSRAAVIAQDTVTGTAIEHMVPSDARIQVITRFLMPLEEQLMRFDIYNGMVAVTADEIVFPEHWETLERQRVLHVSTWKTPWTVNRFFKWLRRKGYRHVTPATADHLVEAAIETLQWFKDHGPEMAKEDMDAAITKNKLLKKIALEPSNVQEFLRPIMSALTAERLLELSAIFRPAPRHYDRAMQEIRKRMPL